MKELTWKPILSNLREALGELARIGERLHFLEFGELPADCCWLGKAADYIAYIKKQADRNPFDEMGLFVSLEHAYHHLNFARNVRCKDTKDADKHFDRDEKFPRAFTRFWPKSLLRKRRGRIKR